jgi:NAD(P)-dependent dehydrogenase (short-subunit alcohol dehydrogenase family)
VKLTRLKDKVCLITGGAGSIGMASARLFLDEGAKVMLVDLKQAALADAAARLGGKNVAIAAADVAKAVDVTGFVAATVARWGKIDVLFSNAGNFGVVAVIEAYPEDVFDAVYSVHVKGASWPANMRPRV